MNSAAEIWERVLSILKQNMTETTISTWFSDIEPVALDENRFILSVPTEFKRDILISRYAEDIKRALYDLFSADLDVVILGEEGKTQFQKPEAPSRFLPGTEEYTFERFVVGNSNKLAHAAALAVLAGQEVTQALAEQRLRLAVQDVLLGGLDARRGVAHRREVARDRRVQRPLGVGAHVAL